MAYGQRPIGASTNQATAAAASSAAARARAVAGGGVVPVRVVEPVDVDLGGGPTDIWEHYTIAPGDWSAGVAVLDVAAGDVTRLKVLERDGEVIFVGLNRDGSSVSTAKGGYELVHPGGGELDESVSAFAKVALLLESGGPPASNVEVWFLGGRYATRSV